jgi:colanic acid/amylovoran biosynthesis glycosyltransferase
MRIAIFVRFFPKVSETFILNQITGLIDRGHEVDIYAERREPTGASHASITHYGLLARTRYFDMPRRRAARALQAPLAVLRNLTRHTPRLLLATLYPGRGGRVIDLGLLYRGLSLVDKAPYDIVHCQFGYVGARVLHLWTSGVLRGRMVVSFRGSDLSQSLATHIHAYQELFRHAGLLLPVSETLRQKLISLGAPAPKVKVHHSGILLHKFRFQPRSRAADEPIRIISVGRFVPKKGFGYAIDAVAQLVAEGHDVTYTLVGSGTLQPELDRRVARGGLEQRVRFLGNQPQEKVIELLQSMHILLAPSVTSADGDQEGIPNVLKEAMALGMPVVSTKHSGIPELVQHGVSGYLAPEHDARALAVELARLVAHPENWPTLGRAGRDLVEAEFNSHKLNDELVALYAALLKSPIPAQS